MKESNIQYTLSIDTIITTKFFTPVGLVDYQRVALLQSTSQKAVALKLETGHGNDFYVSFNNKSGINTDVPEYGNEIIVTRQEAYDEYSWISGNLNATNPCVLLLSLLSGQNL